MKKCIIVVFVFGIVLFMYASAEWGFQADSEDLAVGPIYVAYEGENVDNNNFGLGILRFVEYPELNLYDNISLKGVSIYDSHSFSPYKSQLGLQGYIYQMVSKLLSGIISFKVLYHGLKVLCVMLFVIVICLIVWQLNIKYGVVFAAIFGAVSFFSSWTDNFSNNLYWVEFTWFIPLLLSLFMLNYPHKKNLIYLLFFVSILVKCMCGYEYISTIMASSLVFLLVEYLADKKKRKELFKEIIIIGFISVLAFLLVYVIHAYVYGNGNVLEGLSRMQIELVGRRTYGNAFNYDPGYADSLNATVITVINKYIGIGSRESVRNLLLFISTVTILFYRAIYLKDNCGKLVSMFVLSLLSTLSWIILAKGHSYIHTHINFVMFYMGWVQVSFYIIVESVFKMIRIDIRTSKT